MKKPVTPLLHGLIDYALVTALITLPSLFGINKKAVKIYQSAGASLGVYNALTDHGAGVKPVIPFKAHYKIDYFNLASLALLGLHRNIRKDKAAAVFHGAFLTMALLTVVLTDPNGSKDSLINNDL